MAPQVEVLGALAQDDVADAPGHARRHPQGDGGLEDHAGQELSRGLRLVVGRVQVQGAVGDPDTGQPAKMKNGENATFKGPFLGVFGSKQ